MRGRRTGDGFSVHKRYIIRPHSLFNEKKRQPHRLPFLFSAIPERAAEAFCRLIIGTVYYMKMHT